MDVDPILKLAFAVSSNPGVYAFLLGSGVSRAAGIPTGWDITLDLVRRLARAQGKGEVADPAIWYSTVYGSSPNYSQLLDGLTSTRSERAALVGSYFEPTDLDRDEGKKQPTAAHRAIAGLVRKGFVKMILTTNFDRLIEQAVRDVGVEPDVVSSVDGLKGAIPFVHSRCFILKLNGDYKDTRLKNTEQELSSYGKGVRQLLGRVLDEYGLVVSGWSGTYDTALMDAILRCPNRRFATYWTHRGNVSSAAESLALHRRAEMIAVNSADEFFSLLLEKVESLAQLEEVWPVATRVAVTTLKRYLPDPVHRLRVSSVFRDEVNKIRNTWTSPDLSLQVSHSKSEDLKLIFDKRLRQVQALSERLVAMMAALGFHGGDENGRVLTETIESLLPGRDVPGLGVLVGLRWYPALVSWYAAGVCALAAQRYDNLARVLLMPTYRERARAADERILEVLRFQNVFPVQQYLPDGTRHVTPASEYLENTLRPWLREYFPNDPRFIVTFDLFEYLAALAYVDVVKNAASSSSPGVWKTAVGCFAWRYADTWETSPMAEIERQGRLLLKDWPMLRAGFFGGSPDRFRTVVEGYNAWLRHVTSERAW